MTPVTNWGLYPIQQADVRSFADAAELQPLVTAGGGPAIARGLGRCYGDSALAPRILSSRRADKFLAFDEQTGVLTCQAGVSLAEILDALAPRGWFLPVTPGTKFVTLGGAIAADVHGKNHHKEGNFGHHVLSMDVMRADGQVITCGPDREVEFFETTCGGMGLTGIILQATLRMRRIESAYIREEILPADHLDAVMKLFEQSADWTYSVAWIDCLARGAHLGRSILMRGEHATVAEAAPLLDGREPLDFRAVQKMTVPFTLPGFVLNPLTVRAFNTCYHAAQSRHAGSRITTYDTFFYPLDAIGDWNRIYGKRGFTQYQAVFPTEHSRAGLQELLECISSSGQGSFLAVLKQFGPRTGFISFPRAGYTLALDFPITLRNLQLFDELDEVVLRHGGRLYLAKDVRMSRRMFDLGYENADAFRARVRAWDPAGRFGSRQSQRLGITA